MDGGHNSSAVVESAENKLKGEIAKLLASGLKPVKVANRLGVSASYIAQLADDEEFQSIFRKAHAQKIEERERMLTTQQQIDDFIQQSELRTIEAIYNNLDLINKMPERAMKMFGMLNAAKRRYHEGEFENRTGEGEDVKTVQLELPEHIRNLGQTVNVVKNEKNEVIEVDGKVLKTMPTSVLFAKHERGELREKRIEETPPRMEDAESKEKSVKMNEGGIDLDDL